jgi:hypothetical protein
MQAIDMAISLRLAGSLNEIINACLFFVLMLLCGASGVALTMTFEQWARCCAALAMTLEPMGALLGMTRKAFKMKKHSAVKGNH